ncbi:hypothetical protein BDB01DRAFT_785190 [Pilobolus umbonatus]|nr:hypothetical protein BDB01DRAFT_785190 [Pilobolus umbonatus]
MSHSICKSAKIAICGYWGQQTLPLASMEMPTLMADPHLIIPNLVDPTEATTTQSMSSNSASLLPHSSQPRVVSSLNSPTSIHGLSSAHTSIESISPSSTSIDSISSTHTSISHTSIHSISSAMPSAVPEPHPPVTDFYLDGNHYSIVHQRPDKHGSAESICRVTHNGYLADVSAGELPTVTEHLINLKIDRIVIGSWNSDGYSLTDNSCLILRKDNGISVGQCSDTTYLLCSDQNTSHFA